MTICTRFSLGTRIQGNDGIYHNPSKTKRKQNSKENGCSQGSM